VPTTLTLKNIPDDVHERLRAAAARHRRSLSSEALVYLERVLAPIPTRLAVSERLARARQLRAGLGAQFPASDLAALKQRP